MMLLTLVEVSVKVACRSTTATDCSHRAITMLLIPVEVSESGLSVYDSHRLQAYRSMIAATSILLILVDVSVKVACQSMTVTAQSYYHATYSHGSIMLLISYTCRSTTTTDCKHRAFIMLLILVKVVCRSTTATELSPCYVFWW